VEGRLWIIESKLARVRKLRKDQMSIGVLFTAGSLTQGPGRPPFVKHLSISTAEAVWRIVTNQNQFAPNLFDGLMG